MNTRERVLSRLVRDMREMADVLDLIELDPTLRHADATHRAGRGVPSVGGMASQLNQFADDIKGYMLP